MRHSLFMLIMIETTVVDNNIFDMGKLGMKDSKEEIQLEHNEKRSHAEYYAYSVYVLCSFGMLWLAMVSKWPTWYLLETVLGILLCGILTFQVSPRVQSYAVLFTGWINIFLCSHMGQNVYLVIILLMGQAAVIAIYKDSVLQSVHIGLSVLTVLGQTYMLLKFTRCDHEQMVAYSVSALIMLGMEIYLFLFGVVQKRAEKTLKQSLQDARDAERSKADFLANMSHEIRTPINAIIGMDEIILRDNNLSESVRESCFNIRTAGRSLLAIINDILDFSKIESGKMELIEEEFDIAGTINDVLNMALVRMENKKLELVAKIDPKIPHKLIGDEGRIRQIITNLMTNAVKYTNEGTVSLSITFTKQTYGINLKVSVTDTGIGITEENLEKLFTSFQQVDTKRNRSVEGTGLGLAISKKMVKSMGGFINVQSTYGVGSEFYFVIPLKVGDEHPFVSLDEPEQVHAVAYFDFAKLEQPELRNTYETIFTGIGEVSPFDYGVYGTFTELQARLIEGKVTHCFTGKMEYLAHKDFFDALSETVSVKVIQDRENGIVFQNKIQAIYKPFYVLSIASALNHENAIIRLGEKRMETSHFVAPKARVLIVDDNAINLKVAWGLMRPYRMQVMKAESGDAAIKMLRSKDIDLVFMDHMMPEMDGIEATHVIRAMEGEYYKQLPIIALTANVINGAREMFVKEGLNDFIAKPIELNVLDRILRNYLPSEYIQYVEEQKTVAQSEKSTYVRQSPMFDSDVGLNYAGGTMDTYLEILDLYVKKGVEKLEYMMQLFHEKNWKDYTIEVHALKSASRSIGALRLADLAKELEMAGKAGDYGKIEQKNTELCEMYDAIMQIIEKFLKRMRPEVEKDEEVEDHTALVEITREQFLQYLLEAGKKCAAFDADEVKRIAQEVRLMTCQGQRLREVFSKIAELAEDFEYEEAARTVREVEEKWKIE